MSWKGPGKWLLSIVVLTIIYYLAARIGLLLAFKSTNASPVWPPSGIAVAALLLLGIRVWPGVFLGAIIANIVVFISNNVADHSVIALVSAFIALGNTLEAITAVFVINRLINQGNYFSKPINVYKFLFAITLAALVSASIGTSTLVLSKIAPADAAITILSTWWLGDVSGILILAPFLLAWAKPVDFKTLPTKSLSIALILLAVVVVILIAIFGQDSSGIASNRFVAYLVLPCIGLAAYFYQHRGVTLILLLITGSAVVGTTRGLGPFASGTLQDSLNALEIFIILCGIVGLVLAADVNQKKNHLSTFTIGKYSIPLVHWITLFICLCLTLMAWNFISTSTERLAQNRFEYIAENVKKRIDERMDAYESLLSAGQGLFNASDSVSNDEWKRFVERLDINKRFPGVAGIGFAKRVTLADKSNFEGLMRIEGFKDFHIWPKGERDDYVAVTYIVPLSERNRLAIGYDMSVDSIRRAAIMRARDSGETNISGKVTLIQEKKLDRQAGFLMYAPVYKNGAPVRTKEERAAAIDGYVYSPFRMNDLMLGILGQTFPEVALEIFDGIQENDKTRMYRSEVLTKKHDTEYPNAFTAKKIISVVNDEQNWTLRVTSLPAFESTIDRQKSLIVLITGTMISLLFFGVIGTLAATREKAQALAADMTAALKETNRTLRQSEERFRLLTSNIKDYSILLLDPQGLVLTWNEGSQRLKKYVAEEIVGYSFSRFYPDEDIADGKPQFALQQAREHGQYEATGWLQRKDGTRFYADTALTAIYDERNELIGFAKISRDITQKKLVEEELRSAKEKAESASRAKSEFVANMSHELRTPMNAVLGMAYLLSCSNLTNDQRKYLEMIQTSGQSLLKILNDILDFSKIEAGRMELSLSEFNLSDVMNAVATIMSINAGEKDLELAIGIAPAVPRRLIGDELKLQQVLINLVGNAIKFTEKGQVNIFVNIEDKKSDVATLKFFIRDTGIGMTEEQQARLFSAFTQADSSMTRRFGGTGLGLTICKRFVQLMHGDIKIHSEIDKGSEFCVTVVLQIAPEHEDMKSSHASMYGLNVLVVDDNPLNRDFISTSLKYWKWTTKQIASGSALIKEIGQLEDLNKSYDAILIDWQMPDIDGITAINKIRESHLSSVPPIFLMASAFEQRKLMEKDVSLLGDVILLKPVTGDHVFNVLLEIKKKEPRNHTPDSKQAKASRMQRLDGIHILLAEDNYINQAVARGMLEQAGAQIDIVENGKLAIDTLKNNGEQYQLVLMDVQMPVMDGFTATKLIRKELQMSIPVIAMTAGVTESERIECTNAGMDDFIAKPIDIDQMLTVIALHLSDNSKDGVKKIENQHTQENKINAILDISRLINVSKDNLSFKIAITGAIQRMVRKGRAPIDEIHHALKEGETRDAARLLHTLKGEIGSLGGKRLFRVASALEQSILKEETADMGVLLRTLEEEMQLVLETAKDWLKLNQESEKLSLDTPELDKASLFRFESLLAEKNIEACDVYANIRHQLKNTFDAKIVVDLDNAINGLNFDQAIHLLHEMMATLK